MKRYFSVAFLVLIFLACFLSSGKSVKVMKRILSEHEAEDNRITIVIDPGHGGRDPGKVGVNNALEKDINLSIAMKLKNLLEMKDDIQVFMTREADIGLYDENASNKKRSDLNNRVEFIHNNKADLAISIHQNSFTQENCRGAQVFYYGNSEKGRKLAELVQAQLKETLADGNHRQAKANDSYYMLTKTRCPLVIVECGYLSNYAEAELLLDEEYQEKVAQGIHLGILRFTNESGLE